MTKLLPNLPIDDLTKENDFIGIIDKGNLIKSFFLANKSEFSKIKIFSIYGGWGSGKSTLMKYLQKELKGSFNTFFFESWEFESDKNLSLSLLEYLVEEKKSKTQKVGKELLEVGRKLLEGFARSMTFKTPVLNISADKIIETVKEENPKTFLQLKNEFKEAFNKWENKITEGVKDPKFNIIFIDDLDRCEPENVLNLLSVIKLFFSFGMKTIFVCGIDKKAVSEAVKTKYGEVVKANEYLEKIFDVSFSMPESYDTSKLTNYYFKDELVLSALIDTFFKQLHFTNPRRIKKILNKYLIIKSLKESEFSKNLTLPNIIHKGEGTMFETYLTLYLLILHEFEPETFKQLFNLSAKRTNYTESMAKTYGSTEEISNVTSSILGYLKEKMISTKFSDYNYINTNTFIFFIVNFTPLKVDSLNKYAFSDAKNFISSFNVEIKSFEYYFTIFLFENEDVILSGMKKSNYSLSDYKKMIPNLL